MGKTNLTQPGMNGHYGRRCTLVGYTSNQAQRQYCFVGTLSLSIQVGAVKTAVLPNPAYVKLPSLPETGVDIASYFKPGYRIYRK